MRYVLLAAAIFASLVGRAPAQSAGAGSNTKARLAQAPSSTALPDAMSSYDFVLGKWHCNGVTPQGRVDYTFTQNVSKILNGYWFRFQDASRDDGGEAFMTYDGKRHLWVYLSIDGSGYSIGTSPGWRGNTQTWIGYSYSNAVRRSWGRILFAKVSDREKRENFYAPDKNGRLRYVGSEVCTKTD